MDICSFLLAATIVGAYEFTPGSMHIELLDVDAQRVTNVYMYTDTYLHCMEQPYPTNE